MRLLVLGATGGIGKYLLEYATARGHEVTAFARSPQKIALQSGRLRVVPGDLLNVDQLAQVLPGHDAVLSAFGPSTCAASGRGGSLAKCWRRRWSAAECAGHWWCRPHCCSANRT